MRTRVKRRLESQLHLLWWLCAAKHLPLCVQGSKATATPSLKRSWEEGGGAVLQGLQARVLQC